MIWNLYRWLQIEKGLYKTDTMTFIITEMLRILLFILLIVHRERQSDKHLFDH